jgi:hypothetical protein
MTLRVGWDCACSSFRLNHRRRLLCLSPRVESCRFGALHNGDRERRYTLSSLIGYKNIVFLVCRHDLGRNS